MAKLIDRLRQIGRPASTPLGFGKQREASASAAGMLLIGEAPARDAAACAAGPAGKAVDALALRDLAHAPVPGKDALAALKGLIWGVRSSQANAETLDALQRAGCDFVIVDSVDAPAVALREDEMARGFTIPDGLTESQARVLDDLRFDFLIIDAGALASPLTVARVMELQSIVSMVSKHIVMRVDRCPPVDELTVLRDLPVDALLIDAGADEGLLKEARLIVNAVEPRKAKPERPVAVLPRPAYAHAEDAEFEEGDWDDARDYGGRRNG